MCIGNSLIPFIFLCMYGGCYRTIVTDLKYLHKSNRENQNYINKGFFFLTFCCAFRWRYVSKTSWSFEGISVLRDLSSVQKNIKINWRHIRSYTLGRNFERFFELLVRHLCMIFFSKSRKTLWRQISLSSPKKTS